jgi:short-subunit dehydrogenase
MRKAKRFDQMTAIVTGASSGIGRATAKLLWQGGATVFVAARRIDRLHQLCRELEPLPLSSGNGRIISVECDITSQSDRARLVAQALSRTGRIDILVNNAGCGLKGPVELVPLDRVRACFELNLFSMIGLTQLVIPIMRSQHSGNIVNISSTAGFVAKPFSSLYDASKHALEAVSEGLRGEVRPFGIHVSVIQPSYVSTDFSATSALTSEARLDSNAVYKVAQERAIKKYAWIKRFAIAPEAVAIAVADSIALARPRYLLPFHAKLLGAAMRFLPESMLDRILR